ncbi:MAG: hypothetical protein MO846_06355 [Candidatus Devosia symbiotica]|nr:hypothetical protein [Candidatus Devosia symbiotica]
MTTAGLATPSYINVNTIKGVLNAGGTFTINITGTDVDGDSVDDGGSLGGMGKVLFANTIIAVNNQTSTTAGSFIMQAADTIDTGNTVFSVNAASKTGFNLELYAGTSLGGTPQSTANINAGAQSIDTGGDHIIFDAAGDIKIADPLLSLGKVISP